MTSTRRRLILCLDWLGLAGLCLLLLVIYPSSADPTGTLMVTNTDDDGPGSLRRAIADAQPGDTIQFALSYPTTITLTSGELAITKPLTIAGPGPGLLAVSGDRASRVFRVDNAGGVEQIAVTISGLTIRDGEADDGGGLWNDERLILTDVAVLNNLAQDEGGGLYNFGGSPTLTNVIFCGNAAQGILPLGVHGGGGMYIGTGSPTLINVVFSGNWANQAGGGIHNNGTPTLTNVTLSGNVADFGGGFYNLGSPVIHNSILWGNRAIFGEQIYASSSYPPAIGHSDVEGSGGSGAGWDAALGTDLGGNLDAIPLFVEPVDAGAAPIAGGDLRLWWGSSLINAGDNSLVPPGVTTDLVGVPRIAFGTVDMGSYEYQPGLYLDKSTDEEGVQPGQRLSYTFTVFNAFTDQILTGGVVSDTLAEGLELAGPIEIDPPGAGMAGTAPPLLASDLTVDPGQSVTITVPVTVGDAMTLGIVINSASVTSTQVPTPQLAVHELLICLPHLTVTSDADGGPGSLRQAIGHVCPGGTIEFALSYPATITLSTGELLIVRPLTIVGPGPELLAVSGNDSGRIFRVDRPGGPEQIAVSLSGLTIRDANGDDGGGLWSDENLILTNVVFRGNSAEAGAGMFTYRSSPILMDVTFQDNTVRWGGGGGGGGGIYNYHGSPVLTRVLFSGNGGRGSWPYTAIVGGGMFNWHGNPRLMDVTFSRNSADAGGGIYNYENSNPVLANVAFCGHTVRGGGGAIFGTGGSVTLVNAVLSGNSAEHGGGMQNSGVTATLTNVTLSGNRAWEDGGAIWSSDSSLTIQNSVLWDNDARGAGDQLAGYNTTVAFAHSDVGGSGGSGATWDPGLGTDLGANLDVDPRFVDRVDPADAPTASGNLRLQKDSAAINAGANDLVPVGVTTDADGAPRIALGLVDMGAYEVQPFTFLYLPVVYRGAGP